jgi:hypothetical protein
MAEGTVVMSAARKALILTLAACALLATGVLDAGSAAAPRVRVGDVGGGRIEIEAHDVSLGQVLAALRDSHLIQFGMSDALARTVNGTYTGTLPQVLSRILDGYDYFLQVTPSGTTLHIVNAALSGAVPPSPTAAPVMPITSNADLDEEKAPRAANPANKPAVWTSRSATTPYPVVPSQTAGTTTSRPRISSNLDADEETSR